MLRRVKKGGTRTCLTGVEVLCGGGSDIAVTSSPLFDEVPSLLRVSCSTWSNRNGDFGGRKGSSEVVLSSTANGWLDS